MHASESAGSQAEQSRDSSRHNAHVAPRCDGSFAAKPRAARSSSGGRNNAASIHLGWEAWHGSVAATQSQSVRSCVRSVADRANRWCMPSRQSDAADRVPETVCPRSTRPTLPSTARRWPLPQPTETRGHLPSPSPWNPCPVWFCRPRRPLFAGANIASINASARSNYPPCVRPCSASVRTIFCHAPSRTQR